MSRMPIAGPAGGGAPAYRANMVRRGPVARPAAAPSRPRATKAKATGTTVRKATVRKASAHRPARKASAGVRRVATAAPVFRAMPAPTPMPVAAAELATPRAYALIATTVCESGPAARSAPEVGVPVLDIAPGGVEPTDGVIPGTDTETTLPPIIGPEFPDSGPTGPTGGGPGTPPPVPPIVEPPTGPPIIEPPTTPVPEPATWALMILGFGLLGARLRATSSAASGSQGRAGRPE
ncbi:MAG: PEPxxWA-CTERM sorting domain-containing protein [Alphaproteobacteria bacterium]|nr:PEPxxWA-CTERM sorting domain-containing protein [Alphaproteobacteria bacterium]MBU1514846.1 PEPxxWA-CTERM sorting domain-containing protein [Alphaproteobacteria bacterium]MBU2093767.1 PEPxxWA-CTERM sorting domain-containing protein [Alphaproteobacteria bacterium]MBU2149388.1 PEPxxWA-CTERM sorting domain-containing protein [Alphaproteobacteria bacterium]MBU2305348.1 PEPxxWA-CTERM sorting domain-containing protein [Alphaproteobacteria bacterium]